MPCFILLCIDVTRIIQFEINAISLSNFSVCKVDIFFISSTLLSHQARIAPKVHYNVENVSHKHVK